MDLCVVAAVKAFLYLADESVVFPQDEETRCQLSGATAARHFRAPHDLNEPQASILRKALYQKARWHFDKQCVLDWNIRGPQAALNTKSQGLTFCQQQMSQ